MKQDASLWRQAHTAQQVRESRVGAERIKASIYLKVRKVNAGAGIATTLVALLQPVEGTVLVADGIVSGGIVRVKGDGLPVAFLWAVFRVPPCGGNHAERIIAWQAVAGLRAASLGRLDYGHGVRDRARNVEAREGGTIRSTNNGGVKQAAEKPLGLSS